MHISGSGPTHSSPNNIPTSIKGNQLIKVLRKKRTDGGIIANSTPNSHYLQVYKVTIGSSPGPPSNFETY